jgi:hypothetical protein
VLITVALSFIAESYHVQTVWPDFLSGDHVNVNILPAPEGAGITKEILIKYMLENTDRAIIYENDRGGMRVKKVYLIGDTEFNPEIIAGRSFIDEDFKKRRPVAIINDSEWINRRILLRDGREYLWHENNEYEVIGRFRRKTWKNYIEREYYDASIFVNMNALFEAQELPLLGSFSIDAGRESPALISGLKEKVKSINPDIYIQEIEKSRVDDIMAMLATAVKRSFNFLLILIYTAFLILLNISTITNYWIEGRNKELAIRMLSGGKRSNIRMLILREYLLIVSLAYASGVLLAYMLMNIAGKVFAFGVTIYSAAIITGYLACLLIGVISGLIFITVRLKQNIIFQMRV